HIRLDGARLISEEDFILWTKKAKPKMNDVILSRRCNPGESAYVPESLEIALGQNLVLLRSDGSVIYPPFLRWLVQGNEWWEQVNKFLNVGAVFNSLKCKDIPNFKLTIPSLK
ncbi:restriction endonuclease subunit S, partial [Acinetobacter junii]